MNNRLPDDLIEPPKQFTLGQLLECITWAGATCAYLTYLVRSFHPEDAGILTVLSPMIVLGSLGAIVGCLRGSRWKLLVFGVLLGAAPLAMALAVVLLSQ